MTNNNLKVLIIAPLYDLASAVSTRAALKLESFCIKQKVPYKMLFAHEAFRLPFEITSLTYKPDLIAYFGHAEAEKLFGQHIFFGMLDQANINLLKDSIIYSLSCKSSKILGRQSILSGVKAFFGNKVDYYGAFANFKYDYLRDWLDYVTIIPKALILGKTTSEAFNLYNQKTDMYIKKYNNSKPMDWNYYLNATLSNKNNFELLGDPNITL